MLVVLLVGAYIALQSSYVQTRLTNELANYLSRELNAVVSVDAVDLEFVKTIALDGVYVEDQQGDTLLYLGTLKADVNSYNLSNTQFDLGFVGLENGVVNLREREDGLNLDFLIDYFASDSSAGGAPPHITCDELVLHNMRFRYDVDAAEPVAYGMDYEHLDVRGIQLMASDLKVEADTISGNLTTLAAREKCGLNLKNLAGEILVHPQLAGIQHMTLNTDASALHGHYVMRYDAYPAFYDFIEAVRMDAGIDSGYVAATDIAPFASDLHGLNETIDFSGSVRGPVADLKSKDLRLATNSGILLEGEVDLKGLPDIENTFIRLQADRLLANKQSVDQIPLPPFNEAQSLVTPPELSKLGQMQFSGSFIGYVSDFLAFGELSTAQGNLEADLQLKADSAGHYEYNGQLLTAGFNIGSLLPASSTLGSVGLDLNVEGRGLTLEELDAMLNGSVQHVEVNGYRYRNIDLQGELADKHFTGLMAARDPNANLDFNGTIDFSSELPEYDFTAKLHKANLHKLNLTDPDSALTLATKVTLKLKGTNIDNLRGTASADSTMLTLEKQEFFMKKFYLATGEDEQQNRHLELNSDYVRAAVSGRYKFQDLPEVADYLISNAVPSFFAGGGPAPHPGQQFDFRVEVINSEPITRFFVPDILAPNGMLATGSYNGASNQLDMAVTSPLVGLYGRNIHGLDLQITGRDSLVEVQGETHYLQLTDTIGLRNTEFLAKAINDNIQFGFAWDNKDSVSAGDFTGLMRIVSPTRYNISFLKSELLVNGYPWSIDPGNSIRIDTTSIAVRNFAIGGARQEIAFNGTLSERKSDELTIDLTNFGLEQLRFLAEPFGTTINGTVNGSATLANPYQALLFRCNLALADLVVNEVELGSGNIESAWNPGSRTVALNGNLNHSSGRSFEVGGFYYPDRTSQSLDIMLKTNDLAIDVLAPYVKDFLGELRGSLSGEVTVRGTPEKPLVRGALNIAEADFLFSYLNTHYSIRNEQLLIREDFIGFDVMEVFDDKGDIAVATGTIFHDNFESFDYDVSLSTNKFQFLNTRQGDNYLYYGEAYLSGLVNLSGYGDNIDIEIVAKTERGTRLYVPLDEDEDAEEIEYITFVTHDTIPEEEYEVDLNGIHLDFELEVTPEAEMQMIFDQTAGDIMKGRGYGNLKMEISTLGDFNIYGTYTVTEGDYLFTLQNVINKKFIVNPGGTIQFNGDPYNAKIDIDAIYKLKTSLINIAELGIDSTNARRVPVEVYLQMSGSLEEQDIDFDIKLPSVDQNTQSIFATAIQAEQERNRQVFSLLILNSFMPTSGSGSTGSFTNTGSAELLSNQLSNWLSQISREVDIGFNYRPGDEVTTEEVELALSTQLFDDRVTIETNVGVGGQNTYTSDRSNALVGDFKVEYKISKDGRVRAKAFNESNDYDLLDANNAQYTQGVGVFYTEEFDTFKGLLKKIFGRRTNRIRERDVPVDE